MCDARSELVMATCGATACMTKVWFSDVAHFPSFSTVSTRSRSPIYGRCAPIAVIRTIPPNGSAGAAAEPAEAGDIGVPIASAALGQAGDGGDQDSAQYPAQDGKASGKASEYAPLQPRETQALGIIANLYPCARRADESHGARFASAHWRMTSRRSVE